MCVCLHTHIHTQQFACPGGSGSINGKEALSHTHTSSSNSVGKLFSSSSSSTPPPPPLSTPPSLSSICHDILCTSLIYRVPCTHSLVPVSVSPMFGLQQHRFQMDVRLNVGCLKRRSAVSSALLFDLSVVWWSQFRMVNSLLSVSARPKEYKTLSWRRTLSYGCK